MPVEGVDDVSSEDSNNSVEGSDNDDDTVLSGDGGDGCGDY